MPIHFEGPRLKELRPRIIVCGVGGAGGNSVNNMIVSDLSGVDFIVANTGETLAGLGPLPAEWPHLSAETADLVAAIRKTRTSDDLAVVVKGLESRKDQAEAWLREAQPPVEISPEGPVNEPHNISTNRKIKPKDTVIAAEESSRGAAPPPSPSVPETTADPETTAEDFGDSVAFSPFERVEKLHPGELIELAPRLAEHVQQRFPDWHDVVDAAGSYLASLHDLSKIAR